MRFTVITVGKPKLEYARIGAAEYFMRIKQFGAVDWVVVKASHSDDEGRELLGRSEGLYRVVLDEHGEQVGSLELARRVTRWEHDRVKGVAFLVGGADGHGECVRQAANWKWSLGRQTLQHELALVVMLEQLYRARCINAGMPYHRE